LSDLTQSYSQSTNYYIVFGSERLNDIKFYLKSCNLPGFSLEPEVIRNRLHSHLVSGSNIEYNPLEISVMVDEDFDIYLSILEEIYSYKNPNTGIIQQKPFDTTLFITSNKGNPILKFDYSNCFITNISSPVLNTGSRTVENISFDISIKYDSIEYKKLT